jgi:hypothetical protein
MLPLARADRTSERHRRRNFEGKPAGLVELYDLQRPVPAELEIDDGSEPVGDDPAVRARAARRVACVRFDAPTKLNVPRIGLGHWGTPYDVSPDGSRIYFLRGNDDPPPHEIHVVIGWRALLD